MSKELLQVKKELMKTRAKLEACQNKLSNPFIDDDEAMRTNKLCGIYRRQVRYLKGVVQQIK